MATSTSDVGSCVAVDVGNGVGGLVEPNSVPLTPDGFASHTACHVPSSLLPSVVPRASKLPPKIEPVNSNESPSMVPTKSPGPKESHEIVSPVIMLPSCSKTKVHVSVTSPVRSTNQVPARSAGTGVSVAVFTGVSEGVSGGVPVGVTVGVFVAVSTNVGVGVNVGR